MPLGCFSMAVLFVVFVGAVVLIVFGAVKSADVYKDALAWAKTHPAVIEILVRRSQKDFLFREIRTLTAHPEKLICLFSSPVQKETRHFTWQRESLSGSGTIQGS